MSWGCPVGGREGFRETSFFAAFQYSKEFYKKDEDKCFYRACCDGARGNGFKVKEGRFRLDRRKKLFIMRVVKH